MLKQFMPNKRACNSRFKKYQVRFILIGLLLLTGCETPTLVSAMAEKGITYETTGKIVIIGSEADVGRIQATITTPDTIQLIWDKIHLSRPYQLWMHPVIGKSSFIN